MNNWIIAIIILSIIAVAVIITLILKYKNDIRKLEQMSNENYQKGKDEVTEILKNTIDKIADDKIKFNSMSEKELMVETMIALGSYSRRLDRIEENVTNYKYYVDEMNNKAEILSNNYNIFLDTIKNSDVIVKDFNSTIQDASKSINNLNISFTNIENITQKIDKKIDELNFIISSINDIKDKVSKIIKDMNETLSTYGNSPMTVLKNIESNISKIQNEICNVNKTIDNLNDIDKDDVEYVVTNVLNYNDLCNIYDKINSLGDELESIKNSIDEAFDRYGYDSIYSMISDLSDRINS